MAEDPHQQFQKRIARLENELAAASSRERRARELLETIYADAAGTPGRQGEAATPDFGGITFVVAAYNMEPQLRRTLTSLSPGYQGAAPGDIEVIVVDNGSSTALPEDLQREFPFISQVIRVDGHASPVFALNQGIAQATREWVGLMIDGAHMVTPGIVSNLKGIATQLENPVINIPQYMFGDISQNLAPRLSLDEKYQREEQALRELGWPENGYSLFTNAVFPGETAFRHALDAIESNCLLARRSLLVETGGFDERFDEAGGGLANIELFERLIHRSDVTYVTFAGEGSFHQDHHGTTTSPRPKERQALVRGYFDRYRGVVNAEHISILRSPFVYGFVRSTTKTITPISRDYARDRHKLMNQLADLHVNKLLNGGTFSQPRIALDPDAGAGQQAWSILTPCESVLSAKQLEDKEILQRCHTTMRPRRYLETGVDAGRSLALADCPSIGTGPDFELRHSVRVPVRLYRVTTGVFFRDIASTIADELAEVDLAYLNGPNVCERVLRDFAQLERHISPDALVVIDNVLPGQMEMLGRSRTFNAWCGDAYKAILLLREVRPDLQITVLPAFIGPYRKGMALIRGLKSGNTTLLDQLAELQTDLLSDRYTVESIAQLDDMMAVTGTDAAEQFNACQPRRA